MLACCDWFEKFRVFHLNSSTSRINKKDNFFPQFSLVFSTLPLLSCFITTSVAPPFLTQQPPEKVHPLRPPKPDNWWRIGAEHTQRSAPRSNVTLVSPYLSLSLRLLPSSLSRSPFYLFVVVVVSWHLCLIVLVVFYSSLRFLPTV